MNEALDQVPVRSAAGYLVDGRTVPSRLAGSAFHPEWSQVSVDGYGTPTVAPYLALVLGRRLAGPDTHVADVAAAVAFGLPALVVLDARPATAGPAADGGPAVVLGSRLVPLRSWDTRLEGAVMYLGGRLTGTGVAAAVGPPLALVAQLARELSRGGGALEPGVVALVGPLTPPAAVAGRATVTASFTTLGSLTTTLTSRVGTRNRAEGSA
ncbi:hypothetical protein ABT369_50135 [Dactylosporangium sp. NPDC000244]|uniref:hypothetical protein n=1 Tax=Dactylosporangium sp. NPDC000244 TaxID=3154365 RepID=UPI00331AE3BD